MAEPTQIPPAADSDESVSSRGSAPASVRVRPEDRYGKARTSSRLWAIVLGTGVILLGLGVAYLGYQRFGPKSIDSETVSYSVVDSSTISIDVRVTRKDPHKPAVCIVRARAKDGGESGRREVLITPSADSTVKVTTRILGSRPPVVADIFGCSYDVPSYLRPQAPDPQ